MSPSSGAPLSSEVSRTTRERCAETARTWAGTCAQSSSISSACNGAIAWTSCPSRLPPAVVPARESHSPVEGEEIDAVTAAFGKDTQQQCGFDAAVQPGFVVHPGSSGPRCVQHDHHARSRSGRHVRTTTADRLAVARQSMERTSSPRT